MDAPRDRDPLLDRRGRETEAAAWSTTSQGGAIATAHYRATEAGNALLESGGNAIDAAVAASLALAVAEPAGSGLGGMAMMVVHLAGPGRTFTVEGPCLAPARATPAAVAASHRYRGYRAVAVPGHIAALDHALRCYGTKTTAAVCEPAIGLAEEGVRITPLQHALFERDRELLRQYGGTRQFLDARGEPLATATQFRQPALAKTLRRLASAGLRDFYAGEIAQAIARDISSNGGFVEEADLEQTVAREGRPLAAPFCGGTAHVLGPPGGGLSLAQLLHLQDALDEPIRLRDPAGVALVAKLIRAVRRERKRLRLLVGDQDPGPVAARTLSRAWAERLLAAEPGETSHISVMDKDGNAVALTQSVERSFGSAEACPTLGFLYNGYLRAFKVQNRAHPHFLKPGAVARSNAAPTLILRDKGPWIVIGSTGSERLVSGIFTTLLRLQTEAPFEAVQGPRLHGTPDGVVIWEAGRFPKECRQSLAASGFSFVDLDDYAFQTGGLQLVVRERDRLVAVADPRRDGGAQP